MPHPISHVVHIFSERLHLSSVPNNWDVSSWLCLYSSFFISFSLSCIHLFLKIRFSHFLLPDSVQFQLLHLLLRILQSRKQDMHWDSEVSETNTIIISWPVLHASAAPGWLRSSCFPSRFILYHQGWPQVQPLLEAAPPLDVKDHISLENA